MYNMISLLLLLCLGTIAGEGTQKPVDSEKELKLARAASQGDLKTVKELIASGVSIEALNPETTPLAMAVLSNKDDVVEFLLSKDANAKVLLDGQSLLTLAAANGNEHIVGLLLAKHLDPNFQGDSGISPVHAAKNRAVAKLLLKSGGDLKQKTNNGDTPLHYVVRKNFEDTAQFYIEMGADTQARNKDGKTPHDYANSKLKELLTKKNPAQKTD